MAKVQNMWLKNVVGKVGDSTLYVSGGETIMRNGTSNVKNPQSYAQMIQRVIAKTAMNNYSALQFLANHSFQGKPTGSKCMERFLSRNMRYFRERAAEIVNGGGSLYEFYQFSHVGSVKFVPAAVILSEGKLPQISVGIKSNGEYAYFTPAANENTYASIINTFGLRRGDQVTFVTIEKNTSTGEYIPHYARVILDPRNSDGTPAPLSSEFFSSNNTVMFPNMRNRGSFNFLAGNIEGGRDGFRLSAGLVAAAGIIASRKVNGAWWRSNCKLLINEEVIGADLCSLGSAVDKSIDGTEIYTDNDLYLNNAGSGGGQGESEQQTVDSSAVVNNNVLINGISQDVSGGAVSTDNFTSIVVTGRYLALDTLTIKEVGSQDEPSLFEVSSDSTTATYNAGGIVPNTTKVYNIMFKGYVWFSLTVRGTIQGIE